MISLTVEIESIQMKVSEEPSNLKWSIGLNLNDNEIRLYVGDNPYTTFTDVGNGNFTIKVSRTSGNEIIGDIITDEITILQNDRSFRNRIQRFVKKICYK